MHLESIISELNSNEKKLKTRHKALLVNTIAIQFYLENKTSFDRLESKVKKLQETVDRKSRKYSRLNKRFVPSEKR